MQSRNKAVVLADLENLLGRPFDPSIDVSPTQKDDAVNLVISVDRTTAQGVCVGLTVGHSSPMILGRIQEVCIKLDAHYLRSGSYYIRTMSRECADILSLFHPLTRVIYEPVNYTEEPFCDWGALLVPGASHTWEIHPDYELQGLVGTSSVSLILLNRKTQGIIEVPVTVELEQLIPHIV